MTTTGEGVGNIAGAGHVTGTGAGTGGNADAGTLFRPCRANASLVSNVEISMPACAAWMARVPNVSAGTVIVISLFFVSLLFMAGKRFTKKVIMRQSEIAIFSKINFPR